MIKKFEEFVNEASVKIDPKIKKGAKIKDHNGDEGTIKDWFIFGKDIEANIDFFKGWDTTGVSLGEFLEGDSEADEKDPKNWKDFMGQLFLAVEFEEGSRGKFTYIMPYISSKDSGSYGGSGVSFDF